MQCPTCHNTVDDEASFCPHCGATVPDAPVYDDFRFAAFVSYRHLPADTSLAKRLHTAIEAYRLPKGIAGPPVDDARPRRLGRVFRDADELAASESLPANIREALRRSSALVVVCSPETPKSSWVAQEVELFASFHGRGRIFIALAAGEPAESAPGLLLERTVVGAGGTSHVEPAEPLAADFRPDRQRHEGTPWLSRRKFGREKLRIIAGIAGCRYDELRQRELARKRRRAAAGTAGAVCMALAIGGLGTLAYQQHRTAQAEESRTLAAQAQAQFAEGDRYGAIETALSALPGDDDPDRPLVEEAQTALADALEVYPDSSTYWRSSYCVDMPAPIQETAEDIDQNWFAVLDTQHHLNVYDAVTGRLQCSCELSDADGFDAEDLNAPWHIVAVRDGIIAAPYRKGTGDLTCFDPATGAIRWSIEGLYCHELTVSADGTVLGVAALVPNGEIGASSFRVSDGSVLDTAFVDAGKDALSPTPTACTFGARTRDLYLATTEHVLHVDLATGKTDMVRATFSHTTSLVCDGARVIACSQKLEEGGDFRKIPFEIVAFDKHLRRLWSRSGTYRMQTAGNGAGAAGTSTPPRLWGETLLSEDELALVSSAGSHVRGHDPSDGRLLFDFELSSMVVGVGHMSMATPSLWLDLVAADGSLTIEDPAGKTGEDLDRAGDMRFPCRLKQARVLLAGNDYRVAFGVSADDKRRLIAYHTDYSVPIPDYAEKVDDPDAGLPDPDKQDWTAAELVARAHEVLGR